MEFEIEENLCWFGENTFINIRETSELQTLTSKTAERGVASGSPLKSGFTLTKHF